MKIGILTKPLQNNYGGLIQNYALQTVLKRMGHQVWTIDRIPKTNILIKLLSILYRILKKLKGKKVKLRAWTTEKEYNIISQYTQEFVKKNISTTRKIFSRKQLKKISCDYGFDIFIVGSDQVWRRNLYGDKSFFLDFLYDNNSVKKIAYAVSFGINKWEYSNKETKHLLKLAEKFDAISVREDSGIILCKEYLKVNAIHLLDPAMLLNREDYIELIKKSTVEKSNGDLFTYFLDNTSEKNEIVLRICSELSLEPFEIMPEQNLKMDFVKNQHFKIEKCIFPEVEKWLRAFMDAEFIVTDSFHGIVFSIIFNKQFIAILNSKRGASRFYSLLSIFGLQNRLISSIKDLDIKTVHEQIEYKRINDVLNDHKIVAFKFIKNQLNN